MEVLSRRPLLQIPASVTGAVTVMTSEVCSIFPFEYEFIFLNVLIDVEYL